MPCRALMILSENREIVGGGKGVFRIPVQSPGQFLFQITITITYFTAAF